MKIEVNNLSKKFGNNLILDDINVTFEDNKIYGIIGKNGSGKSVFLKILCGFYYPNKGTIKYNDIDITKSNKFPESTRVLIESPDFIPDLTGYQNLKLLANIQNKINDDDIFKAMKEVNVYDEKDKKYSKYSLGTKQKLGLAQVIMENPNVMIFDEPLNGIEDESAKKFRDYLKKQKGKNKIIIIASHIKEDIDLLCDVTYKFEKGKLELLNERKTKKI